MSYSTMKAIKGRHFPIFKSLKFLAHSCPLLRVYELATYSSKGLETRKDERCKMARERRTRIQAQETENNQ